MKHYTTQIEFVENDERLAVIELDANGAWVLNNDGKALSPDELRYIADVIELVADKVCITGRECVITHT